MGELRDPPRRARVLVVEDDPVNVKAILAILSSLGYAAEALTTGMEAVEACERAHYDAILMDCDLPGMDGFKATAWIRQREGSARHTPIVAVTASVAVSEREKCLAAGMDDFLGKPVTEEMLGATLRRWLEPPTSASTPEAEEPATSASCLPPDHPLRALDARGLGRVAAEIIDVFLQSTPQRLREIRLACERGQASVLVSLCHTLKGAAVQVGARQMAGLCARLQAAARAGQSAEWTSLAAELEADYSIVSLALKEEGERLTERALREQA